MIPNISSHMGSLRALEALRLGHNLIGDPGMIEFSRSIANGSSQFCEHRLVVCDRPFFDLRGNPGNSAPVDKAFAEKWWRRVEEVVLGIYPFALFLVLMVLSLLLADGGFGRVSFFVFCVSCVYVLLELESLGFCSPSC